VRNRKGFTLVEILIVITIIAIVFLAMAINISGLQNEARISRIRADLKTLQLAIESYYKNYMYVFPPVENYQTVLLDATPRVLESNLIDPFGATTSSLYAYDLSPGGAYFIIYSRGMGGGGEARVDDSGTVSVAGSPVWVSNGHK